jgi:hypothetical protein
MYVEIWVSSIKSSISHEIFEGPNLISCSYETKILILSLFSEHQIATGRNLIKINLCFSGAPPTLSSSKANPEYTGTGCSELYFSWQQMSDSVLLYCCSVLMYCCLIHTVILLQLWVTRFGLWRLIYHSWHKLHFYKKIKCCKMVFWYL